VLARELDRDASDQRPMLTHQFEREGPQRRTAVAVAEAF
jgi:hypothetical protein